MDCLEHTADKAGRERVAIPRAPTEPEQSRVRVKRACQTCRERKNKCGGEKPSCRQCLSLNVECVYPLSRREENKVMLERLQSQNERYESSLREIADAVDSIAGNIQQTLRVSYCP